MTQEQAAPRYELGSVDRALGVLSLLAVHPRIRLGELSELMGANPSTVLRTLRVLERHGLVRRAHGDVEYVLGTRLVELGHAAVAAIDIVPSLRPLVAPLVREFRVTAHLGMWRMGMVTILDKVDPPAPTVGYSAVGTRMPLHATAGGKAAAALAGAPAIEGLSDGDLEACTPLSIRSVDALAADLAQTRARRFSIEREEYHLGFGCVGSAVSVDGDIYTVSLSGSLLDPAVMQACGESLRDAMDGFLAQHAGAVTGL